MSLGCKTIVSPSNQSNMYDTPAHYYFAQGSIKEDLRPPKIHQGRTALCCQQHNIYTPPKSTTKRFTKQTSSNYISAVLNNYESKTAIKNKCKNKNFEANWLHLLCNEHKNVKVNGDNSLWFAVHAQLSKANYQSISNVVYNTKITTLIVLEINFILPSFLGQLETCWQPLNNFLWFTNNLVAAIFITYINQLHTQESGIMLCTIDPKWHTEIYANRATESVKCKDKKVICILRATNSNVLTIKFIGTRNLKSVIAIGHQRGYMIEQIH